MPPRDGVVGSGGPQGVGDSAETYARLHDLAVDLKLNVAGITAGEGCCELGVRVDHDVEGSALHACRLLKEGGSVAILVSVDADGDVVLALEQRAIRVGERAADRDHARHGLGERGGGGGG